MCIYWKVRTWDKLNQPTSWSNIAFWEMILMSASEWQAKWISSKIFQSGDSLNLRAPYFRKDIQIQKKTKRVRVYVTGLGYNQFHINGQKIGDNVFSPNQTNYDKRKLEKWNEKRIGKMQTSVL